MDAYYQSDNTLISVEIIRWCKQAYIEGTAYNELMRQYLEKSRKRNLRLIGERNWASYDLAILKLAGRTGTIGCFLAGGRTPPCHYPVCFVLYYNRRKLPQE